jgi:hypothetical protein
LTSCLWLVEQWRDGAVWIEKTKEAPPPFHCTSHRQLVKSTCFAGGWMVQMTKGVGSGFDMDRLRKILVQDKF